jgi:hypothetical protein
MSRVSRLPLYSLLAWSLTGFAGAQTGTQVPDFSLRDVNASSPRYGEQISPRDYLRRVSIYYFIGSH